LIPEEVLVKNFWEDQIAQMTVEKALDSLYAKALTKANIIPVAQWIIKEVISQSPLKVVLHVEVLPEVEIDEKALKNIKLKKKSIKVTQKEVEAALEDIKRKFTKFENVDDKNYKAKMWDKVKIDTDWYDDKGNLLDTTSMRNFELVLGSNILVPGFEEKIAWHKIDEEFEEDISFPKDYHNKDFAWKTIRFKIKINEIQKAVQPEFTKEFIKDLRWKDLDLEGFKKLIKEEIKDVKESNARIEEEEKLIDELEKVSKLEIWPNLLLNQIEKVFAEVKENLAQTGAKMEDYVKSLGLTIEEYKEKHIKPIALKRLKWELILKKLKDIKKDIEVKKEEIEEEIEKIIKKFENSDVVKRLKELYVEWTKYYEELKLKLHFKKIIDSFFEEDKKK
jgi:trigger factor